LLFSGEALAQTLDMAKDDEDHARMLLQKSRAREAIESLKMSIDKNPQAMTLRLLIAQAYLKDGNQFWALRSLKSLSEKTPDDCQPRLWMAWIYSLQGNLEAAQESLNSASCAAGSPSETQKTLLLSHLEFYAHEPELARRYLDSARKAEAIFKEDQALLLHLTQRLDPGSMDPLTAKLELGMGFTSNVKAGSPVDPISEKKNEGSPLGQLTIHTRLVAPTQRFFRPALELETRNMGFVTEAGQDLSYLMMGARPGVLLGRSGSTALFVYHIETMVLAGGDRYTRGPLSFYTAHRGEFEANVLSRITLFGGVGRRMFRESRRSRFEVDGGLGGVVAPASNLRLIAALTARWQAADQEAYDLWGGSLLLSGEMRLPNAWTIRAGSLLSYDRYPHSTGYFQPASPSLRRRDTLFRLSGSLFSPSFSGFKVGATYEYAQRFSTTPAYDYQDHRILAKLVWTFAYNPWAPKAVTPMGHVPMDYGLETSRFDDRLQDLLRQDEAAQRSSSCME
jgi:tetratricopeptide (TPR) repeat protein